MDGNGIHTETGRIDVVSCGIGFPEDAETLGLIARADVVYGSRPLLSMCPVTARSARIIGAKAREDAADALALCRAGRRVVALASGDALYHGFGGTLSGMAQHGDIIIYHPGITAFQALFHRLGLPWQDARLFSAHSGETLPVRAIAEAPLSVAYAGSRYPAHAIAQAVLGVHPASADRAAVIAERLGSPEERLLSGPLADLARTECGPTSILLLFPNRWDNSADACRNAATPLASAPILTLGLPEDDYERENNLITASDVRAVILSRLRLPAWGTLWDIGAGSGSVGLEAAGLRPNLNVVGIERKPERGALIERNRARLGVSNYTVYIGNALDFIRGSSASDLPEDMPNLLETSSPSSTCGGTSGWDKAEESTLERSSMCGGASGGERTDTSPASPYSGTPAVRPPHLPNVSGKREDGGPEERRRTLLQKGFLSSPGVLSSPLLPAPDRIFIGGGGRDLPELLTACMERLSPGGIMAASAVTLESFHALSAWSPERRTGLCSLNIAHEHVIAGSSHHLKQQNTIYLFTFEKETTL